MGVLSSRIFLYRHSTNATAPTKINSVVSSQNSNHTSVSANIAFNATRKKENPSAPMPAHKSVFVAKGSGVPYFTSERYAPINAVNASAGRMRRS